MIKFFFHHAVSMGPSHVARPIAVFVRASRTADGLAQRFVERVRGILRSLKALFIRPESSMQLRQVGRDKLRDTYMAIDLESDGKSLQASLVTAFEEHGTVSNFLRQLSDTPVVQACFEIIKNCLFAPILEGREGSAFIHLMALDSTARAELLKAIQKLDDKQARDLNVKIMELAGDIFDGITAGVQVPGGQFISVAAKSGVA